MPESTSLAPLPDSRDKADLPTDEAADTQSELRAMEQGSKANTDRGAEAIDAKDLEMQAFEAAHSVDEVDLRYKPYGIKDRYHYDYRLRADAGDLHVYIDKEPRANNQMGVISIKRRIVAPHLTFADASGDTTGIQINTESRNVHKTDSPHPNYELTKGQMSTNTQLVYRYEYEVNGARDRTLRLSDRDGNEISQGDDRYKDFLANLKAVEGQLAKAKNIL